MMELWDPLPSYSIYGSSYSTTVASLHPGKGSQLVAMRSFTTRCHQTPHTAPLKEKSGVIRLNQKSCCLMLPRAVGRYENDRIWCNRDQTVGTGNWNWNCVLCPLQLALAAVSLMKCWTKSSRSQLTAFRNAKQQEYWFIHKMPPRINLWFGIIAVVYPFLCNVFILTFFFCRICHLSCLVTWLCPLLSSQRLCAHRSRNTFWLVRT